MKKTLIISVAVVVVFIVAFTLVLRFPPWAIGSALSVATGLSAKIGCSHYFVSGFSPAQITDDLATYSPATRLVDMQYDEQQKQVSAEIFGMRRMTTTYRPGLGCTFDNEQSATLDSVMVRSIQPSLQPWPAGNDVDTIIPDAQNQLDEALKTDNEKGLDTRALLVVKNGKVIAESYAQNYHADSQLLGWSMGKSITAILIGSLLKDERLTLDETALFDLWHSDERNQISLRHLLTMTDGLGFDETYTPGSDSTKMLFGEPSVAQLPMEAPQTVAPGEHFSYSSGTSNLLAKLVYQRAGNSPQANHDYFHSRIVKPLGLSNTLFETDGTGAFVGSSYIYATARDWAKMGYLLENQGNINGEQVLPENYVRELSLPNTSANAPDYGYQVWLNAGAQELNWPSIPQDAYAMRGNRGQAVMIIPSLDTVIVRLGWSSVKYSLEENLGPIVQGIAERGQN